MKRTYLLTLALGLLAATIVAPKLFLSTPKAAQQASTVQARIPTSARIQKLTANEGSQILIYEESGQKLSFEPIGTVTVFWWVPNEPDCHGKPGNKVHRGDVHCTYGEKVALSFNDKNLGHIEFYNPSSYTIRAVSTAR